MLVNDHRLYTSAVGEAQRRTVNLLHIGITITIYHKS